MPWTASRWSLWCHWVLANAIGEFLGLGTVAAVGYFAYRYFGEPVGVGQVVGAAFAMVAVIAASLFLAGAVVGAVHGWVLLWLVQNGVRSEAA